MTEIAPTPRSREGFVLGLVGGATVTLTVVVGFMLFVIMVFSEHPKATTNAMAAALAVFAAVSSTWVIVRGARARRENLLAGLAVGLAAGVGLGFGLSVLVLAWMCGNQS